MSEEDLSSRLEKFALKLTDRHKLTRKDGLVEYQRLLFEEKREPEDESFPYSVELSKHIITFTNLLSDESEINRIKVSEIIMQFIRLNSLRETHLIYFVTAIHNQIANKNEESEEVKTNLIIILHLMINQFGPVLGENIDDITAIQLVMLLEKSPELLTATCNCITTFADAMRRKITPHSQQYIVPLSRISLHQRFRVRKAALHAIGNIEHNFLLH